MDIDRPTKVIADEVLVLDSSTFIKEVGLTKKGASALKHYLFHPGDAAGHTRGSRQRM